MVALAAAVRTPVVLAAAGWGLLGKVTTVAPVLTSLVMAAAVVALVLRGPITLTHLLLVVLVWRHQSQEPRSLGLAVVVAVD